MSINRTKGVRSMNTGGSVLFFFSNLLHCSQNASKNEKDHSAASSWEEGACTSNTKEKPQKASQNNGGPKKS